jgi:hypothetical protein
MNVMLAIAGLLLIGVILWEVFSDLFHPARSGALTDWVGRRIFNAFKSFPDLLPLAGPLTLISVFAIWVAGLVIGFALVYLHAYPADFRTSTGSVPPATMRLVWLVYYSFETLVTLGYGDLVPVSVTARSAATVEALIGFGLLTASVSSIVLLYPALSRMRLLARGVSHLVAAERHTGIAVAGSGSDVVLNGLARDVTHARIDLVHFPIVYYFVGNDPRASIAMWVKDLMRFAREAQAPSRPEHVRLAGGALDAALHDFAAILDERFLHTASDSRERIFDSLVRDHVLDR